MNIKLFFVICSCKALPPDIICKIWELVKHSAADSIINLYRVKVQINFNILQIFVKLSNDNEFPYIYTCENINNFILFYMNKITYAYIKQEKLWLRCFLCIIEDHSEHVKFNINNVYTIMNNIFTRSTEFSHCKFLLIPSY
jgi:hypothetical protein